MSAVRLVKHQSEPDLSAFPAEQRAQLLAWDEAKRRATRQGWRDLIQAMGAVFAALRRLAGEK